MSASGPRRGERGGVLPHVAAPHLVRAAAPLRIGILAPPWVPVPPPAYGGTEGVLDRLARGLQAAGHEVRLWTTGDSTCPVPRGYTFESARADDLGTNLIELQHATEAYAWFAEEGCDLVHDHTLVGPFLETARPPVITTNHGPFDSAVLIAIYRRLPPSVPIIAISHSQAAVAEQFGIRPAHVIHHGIDVDEIAAGDGGGDARGPYLLFLGRMSPDKGVTQAIDVAADTGWRLLIAAKMREPAELEFYEHHVAPRCAGGIEYIGEVGGADKARLLGGATALLNPIQWSEPFGLVMIEALATGTPVIATRRGAAPEIVDDGRTGYICDDHDALSRAVQAVGRIDRRECRTDVARRFSTGRMVEAHVAAYGELLASADRGDRRPVSVARSVPYR